MAAVGFCRSKDHDIKNTDPYRLNTMIWKKNVHLTLFVSCLVHVQGIEPMSSSWQMRVLILKLDLSFILLRRMIPYLNEEEQWLIQIKMKESDFLIKI